MDFEDNKINVLHLNYLPDRKQYNMSSFTIEWHLSAFYCITFARVCRFNDRVYDITYKSDQQRTDPQSRRPID